MEQDCSGHTEQRTLLLVLCGFHNLFQMQKAQKAKTSGAHLILNFPLPAFTMALMTTAWVGSFQALVSESVPLSHDNTYLCFDLLHFWSYMATHSLYIYPETLMEGANIIPILCLQATWFVRHYPWSPGQGRKLDPILIHFSSAH